jgi:hypothetical protein
MEGFILVHFHVVPRLPDQPVDRRGPAVFGYLGVAGDRRVSEQRQDELAEALQAHLL